MIHFSEIKPDTDDWELFPRDFLRELGLTIESPPIGVQTAEKTFLRSRLLKATYIISPFAG